MKIGTHGEVTLLDVMGDDRAIADAARLSYRPDDETRKKDPEPLIRYLYRHLHTSPFEMAELKFYIKCPIFVARQWIRHRTANVNEASGRYTIMPDEFFVPELNELGVQSLDNKQGTGESLSYDLAGEAQSAMKVWMDEAFEHYHDLVNEPDDMAPGLGMSKEMARIVLPLSTYTEFVWKIDLHNLFHFLKLRTDPHAQKQIRDFADAMEEIVADHFPLAWRAWIDYSKLAYHASRMEVDILRGVINRMMAMDRELNIGFGTPAIDDIINQYRGQMSDREVREFRDTFLTAE